MRRASVSERTFSGILPRSSSTAIVRAMPSSVSSRGVASIGQRALVSGALSPASASAIALFVAFSRCARSTSACASTIAVRFCRMMS